MQEVGAAYLHARVIWVHRDHVRWVELLRADRREVLAREEGIGLACGSGGGGKGGKGIAGGKGVAGGKRRPDK